VKNNLKLEELEIYKLAMEIAEKISFNRESKIPVTND
jgi:hypothetical protein